MKLTQEIIEKAKAAGSAEELLAIAKENGIDMTADEAATYFAQLNPKSHELDEDLLDGVAGGFVQIINPSSSRLSVYDGSNIKYHDGRRCPQCGHDIFTYNSKIKGEWTTCKSCNYDMGCVQESEVYAVADGGIQKSKGC